MKTPYAVRSKNLKECRHQKWPFIFINKGGMRIISFFSFGLADARLYDDLGTVSPFPIQISAEQRSNC